MAKLPRRPQEPLPEPIGPELRTLPAGQQLFRIYRARGRHAASWRRFRTFGPVRNGRFDHHQLPRAESDRGILYAAFDVKTAVAEAFGDERMIDRTRDEPYLVRFRLTRRLVTLDLTSDWPTRAGASQELSAGPRPTAQAWSRQIWKDFADVEGLVYRSSMHGGGANVALYERAWSAIPTSPDRVLPLSLHAFEPDLIRFATQLGYAIR